MGLGTERVEDLLRAKFPSVPLFRIDRDSTRRKDALSNITNAIHDSEAAILVGTQMLAKGHHFPRVTLAISRRSHSGRAAFRFPAVGN